jgi:hypothetical protein
MAENSGFWRVVAKISQARDQVISQVRDEYSRLDKERRRILREWVEKIAVAGPAPVHKIGHSVSVAIRIDVQGLQEMETISVSPSTLVQAIDAWDRGEDYVHNLAEF